MEIRLAELPWLAPPPADFRDQLRGITASAAASAQTLRRLATYRLSCNQLHWLGNAATPIIAQQREAVRLGVVSNGTTDLLIHALVATGLRHGICLQATGSGFDQVAPAALDRESEINRAHCQFVLLAVDHRGLPLTPCPGDAQRGQAAVNEALEYIYRLAHALRNISGCTVILQTAPQVPEVLFGSLERRVPGSLQWLIERYNQQLRAHTERGPELLLDAAAMAETVGLDRWHDPVQWTLGKFPFAQDLVALYADWAARLIAAARGKARKCLVLDLDDTLWGGVIGDVGLEGIELGNGSPAGEAFLSIQRTALALRERGIILAVSSKNDDSVARAAFGSHPDMLLKEEHIAVFQANWQDKASNLKAIAAQLDIGLDSLVLLDDNPAERAQVREALPDIAVPELPSDPAFYARVLLAAGYFEATAFTAEDRARAGQYQANAARAQVLGAATDVSAYLQALRMQAICGPFARSSRSRVTQLINKSNQFNLTTRRYTESEVAMLEHCDRGLTLQMRLLDRFGDNGIIAVVICRDDAADWVIDTWLMSCRVLERQVERATLNYVVSRAKKAHVRALIGDYRATARNGIVRELYSELGFELLYRDEEGSRWRLDVCSYTPVQVPIEIITSA